MSIRRIIDTFPAVGRAIRDVRDRRAKRSLTLQRHPGFDLWGGNYLAAGLHEEAERGIITDLLESADVLVDVGANSGLFSCLSASMGIPCLAFEPMPANLPILLRNIVHNGFQNLVEVFPIAASDSVGVLPFYGRGQGASLTRGWGGVPDFDRIFVPTNTLDNLLADRLRGKRPVLKIDVEGAELAVLLGAERLLTERPPVLIEVSLTRNHPGGFNPDFLPIFETFWSRGYSAFVANEGRDPVDRATVEGWIAARASSLETENFLFLA